MGVSSAQRQSEDSGKSRPHGWWSTLLEIIGFAVVFFCLQRLTFLLRFPPYQRTTLWVPGALTFSALLLSPTRGWWKFYIGLCIAAVTSYYDDREIPPLIALLTAQVHFLTVAAGVWTMRRFSTGPALESVGSMLAFVISAGVLVPLATTAPDFGVRLQRGDSDVGHVALRTFLCVALGMLIGTPAFTTAIKLAPNWFRTSSWRQRVEVFSLALALVTVGLEVFTTSTSSPISGGTEPLTTNIPALGIPALVYVPIPVLLWAALRLEVAGASWSLLTIAYISTWNAINNRGPFSGGTPDDHVLQLQLFLLAVTLPLLFMAAGVGERRFAYSQLLDEIQERRRMEDRLRLVVESTPNVMLMINARGTIMLANKTTERLYGYHQKELVGEPFSRLFPARLHKLTERALDEFFAEPQARAMGSSDELLGMKRDGVEFPLEIMLTPIDSSDGILALAAVTDNTERRRAEEARRELLHASRLAMLSEFTTSIAHEINQPLGAILSNADAAELLLETPAPPLDEVRRILADIRSDDLRASEVIRKLRGLLRRGEIERQSLDLHEVVRDVITILRAETERRGIPIELNLKASQHQISGDKVHLQQILLNLLVNSLEALSDWPRERRIRVATCQVDQDIKLLVHDTGPGISPDRIPRLFERFYSTKREGMGMGLAIARSLIEEHGGRIGAEGAEGHGATFWFTIPIAE
ncbi:MAG: ATP-binding protein [Planctomycetota bacterium]